MSDNISSIAKALVASQKAMGNAVKDSKNPFFKSSYADLNAIREAVLPVFNENGISVLQPTVTFEGRKYVQTIAIHESGEFISGLTEILAVKELDAQAQGSGISYARRYGLQSLANVGAEDDDGNSASGKTAAPIRNSNHGDKMYNGASVSINETPEPKKPTPQPEQKVPSSPNKKSFRTPKPGSDDL